MVCGAKWKTEAGRHSQRLAIQFFEWNCLKATVNTDEENMVSFRVCI